MQVPYDVEDIIITAFSQHGLDVEVSCLSINYNPDEILKVEYEYDLYLKEYKDVFSVELILDEVKDYISSQYTYDEDYDLVLICNLR